MKSLYKFIYFKLLKWKLIGDFPADLKKYLVIAVPHTSWHDFYIGLLLRKIKDTPINFVAKDELFKGVVGWYLKKVGGVALDRTPGQNKVQTIAKLFETRDEFRLNIAPEGTRKKVKEWKTGFYYIAREANVPIVMITFDFGKKQNVISKPFYPTDNMEADFKFMHAFFKGVKGKVPEYSFETD
ncbi:1-acyl-sn-glycerol-3-phosphate acyltransferase [Formosa sp. PL04]|uniref:1-acyl-sn-glycerol-3-phosphate acyltransferase n=1 Tax=Formosa sp. PL04 TaxID=3081755 RepID=UPI0029813B93|nr:1-acyl-sn-glycerol-3-phosphate acyltransferase [Formosa sp. PL04]MDW5288225.1 1-acyl-sn-glycerol-3-phosphate acyltransferase [Formosa sp. PL04]